MVNGPGVKELGVSVNNNLALIYTNSKKYSKAVQHAKDALVHDSEDVKAHFRLGTALEHQGELQLALDSYKKALSIDPNNTAVKKSLAGVSTKIKNKLEQEKKLYQNMFSSTTLYEAPPSAKEHDPSNPVVYLDISIGS
jgi:tetratricopeptide (TPR) repeat protein